MRAQTKVVASPLFRTGVTDLANNVLDDQVGIAAALVTCAWHLQLIFTGLWVAPKLRGLNMMTVALGIFIITYFLKFCSLFLRPVKSIHSKNSR